MKKLELKKRFYVRSFLKSLPHVLGWKLFRIKPSTSSFLRQKLDLESSNALLKEKIRTGEPFAAIRIGAVEMGALNNYEKIQLGFQSKFKKSVQYSMKNNAGFFPTTEKNLSFYAKHFFKDASKTDVLGISGIHMEAYFAQRYMPKAVPILYEAFEPLHGDWIQALAGKKILVISPFEKDIQEQYNQREKLFPKGVIPTFDLLTYAPPLTLGEEVDPRYDSWFEALDEMKVDLLKLDFDLALIGAGAYGSFLAWYIKESLRKQAIQTGGATQTMFGLLGRRWEKRDHVARYVNDYWKRPSRQPKGVENIEHGAYW